MAETEFITDRQIYERVLQEQVPNAKNFVWIGTSDIKDLHVDSRGRIVPFLRLLSNLIIDQISIRLLHAKEPGKLFREDFDKYPNLIGGIRIMIGDKLYDGTIKGRMDKLIQKINAIE